MLKPLTTQRQGSVEVSVGDSVRFIATGELSATGFNPTIRMYYDKSGVQQYDSGEIADNPPPTVAFATPLFTILSGADYYVNVISKVATVNPFAFTPQIEVSPSTPIPSNTITVGGSGGPVPISVVNGMYSINSGPYTAAAGSVNIGDTVSVQVMSSSAYKTAASATLTIADQSETFTVTTFHVFTLNMNIQEGDPYSDSNGAASNDGMLIARQTATGLYANYVRQSRKNLIFECFSELPSLGTGPTKTMRIDRTVGGVTTTIYGPTTNSNNPGDLSLSYNETGVDDATYDMYCSAATTALPAGSTGILVVDIDNDTALNATGFIDTPGITPYQIPAYTGLNFEPNDGTPAQACYILASDIITDQGSLAWRFEFNIALLQTQFPGVTSFVCKIKGRSTFAGSIGGRYSLKSAAGGTMKMLGSAGSYLPSTNGTTEISTTPFSDKAVTSGANGTYGISVGADILVFTYDVVSKTMTLS
jgi:hypothetical protein